MLRYPGGKSRVVRALLPYVYRQWSGRGLYVEPFTGGGSVGLAVAEAYPLARLHLNDADPDVAAFWREVVSSPSELASRVESEPRPSLDTFAAWRVAPTSAMRTLFLNRTTFSGILTSGPIGGAAQASRYTVDCRWNGKRLADRIRVFGRLLLGRAEVTCLDFAESPDADFTYLDPPYWGRYGLYPTDFAEADHFRLADWLRRRRGGWVLSYNDCPEVREAYSWARVERLQWSYTVSTKRMGQEVVVCPR